MVGVREHLLDGEPCLLGRPARVKHSTNQNVHILNVPSLAPPRPSRRQAVGS